ncbi:hypothetical protein F5B20DRAFT_584507 [Whalleya microplaca]|nr:hypothetical protein F5B20DRAFT_584507 [Whalleya microplaca]
MHSTPGNHVIRHGFSGFGPRNSLLFKNAVVAFLSGRETFNKLGLILEFHVFEQNPATDAGAGNAFQMNCDATVNSDITGAIQLFGSDKIPSKYQHVVAAASNLASAVSQEIRENRDTYEGEIRKTNPAASALLKETTRPDGSIDTDRACATRGLIGRVQRDTIQQVIEFVQKELADEIRLHFYYETTVVSADFSTPSKPQFCVRRNDSTVTELFTFDFVHLANGTTGEVLVSEDVRPFSYSGTPNAESIRTFLSQHGVLDSRGLVKTDTKIGITGMRLSAYDCVPIVLNMTGILRNTEAGWALNEEKAAEYQGLFTFISRTDGEASPPRHAHDMYWPGKYSFLSTEEVHAIMLQHNFDWLSLVMPILKANVAAELGLAPSQIERPMTMQQRMQDYHDQNNQYREGLLTEVGLLRTGNFSMVEGYGFESNPEQANRELLTKAPLTREDRAGFPMRKSCAYDITQAPSALESSNSIFFRHWETFWSTIAASPVAVHDIIAQLFKLGVATHFPGSFSDIHVQPGSTGAYIGDKTFDVLFAPKLFTPSADIVLTSLRGKVKEVIPGVPEYAKGRLLQTKGGEYIHAVDVGSGGHGASVTLPNGQRSKVGMQWADTNNHLAAADWAATASRMLVILSVLKASGCEAPVKSLMETYLKSLPTDAVFDGETARFQEAWQEVHEKSCFLRLLDQLQDRSYNDDLKLTADRDARQSCVDHLDKMQPGVKKEFELLLEQIPAFKPVSKTHFYWKRFLDFTPVEMERIFEAVLKDPQ